MFLQIIALRPKPCHFAARQPFRSAVLQISCLQIPMSSGCGYLMEHIYAHEEKNNTKKNETISLLTL